MPRLRNEADVRGKIYLLPVVMLCAALLLTGCDTGKGEQNTAAFDENTVFSVGGINVSYPEWTLYVQPVIDETQRMYGDEIWDFVVDDTGKTYAEAFKYEMKDKIAYVKIVCMQAQSMGISLNEDEMIDVNLQTEDYLAQLTEEEMEQQGITPELVRQIYSDNQLAMRVYEHLTLNVDTYIPEDDVRYMVLQYITILKYRSDNGEEQEPYTEEELEDIYEQAKQLEGRLRTDTQIKELSDLDEEYTVTELIINREELSQKLSDSLADAAFNLSEGEISGLIDTEEAYFILDCVAESHKEMTDAAKIKIIEERQNQVFAKEYAKWEAEAQILVNSAVWDKINPNEF